MDVLIVGGGIGGLTLALNLHAAGIPCRIYEAASELREVGVGINLLPHATRELKRLGVLADLEAVAVETRHESYFSTNGQFIFTEKRGRFAGYDTPQLSIHRGDLHLTLLRHVRERLGPGSVVLAHRCTGFEIGEDRARALFERPSSGRTPGPVDASVVIGADGINSAIRHQLHPDEGPPVYSGYNMWRGTTWATPYLDGATMVRAGWLATGKLVAYPIRKQLDEHGRQLINWLWEIETPDYTHRDWDRIGRLEDFVGDWQSWVFDWLNVVDLFRNAEGILEYPMVDQDPLPYWTRGRVTLLGDAAHPMYPRGSNGSAQAMIDARVLTECLQSEDSPAAALKAYETERRPATSKVVLSNRTSPPDVILKAVYDRVGNRPFRHIDDVISQRELQGLLDAYKRTAGFSRPST